MFRIIVEASLCDGCMECVRVCNRHFKGNVEKPVNNGELAHSACYVKSDQNHRWVPLVCRQCREPDCEATCMSGAIRRDLKSGSLTYDRNQCAACFMCVMNCPYGMPKPEPDEKKSVIKCDLCLGEGGPLCVAACHKGALQLMEVEKKCDI